MEKIINIIIPVYNEGENIIKVLNQINTEVKTPYNVLIIYDNEDDTTLKPAKKYCEKSDSINLIKNKFGSGGLNAVKTGFEVAEGGVTILVMADLVDDIRLIDRMFNLIDSGFDVVCASRYMRGGKQIGGIWYKKFLSRLAGVSLHYLIKIPTHDISNSYKMYRTDIIKKINIKSRAGFEIIVELIIKSYIMGYKITEIPTVWQETVNSDSQFKLFKWLKFYIYWYIYAIKKNYFRNLK